MARKIETIREIPDISDVEPTPEYNVIWEEVALSNQKEKASLHGLSEQEAIKCYGELSRRPYYLCTVAKMFDVKNVAEVGTANGLQYFSFAEMLKTTDGHIWSCDIKDARNKQYIKKYSSTTTFCKGDSAVLAADLLKKKVKIDLFYIDGGHESGDVVKDVYNLSKVQSRNPIWIFDDFDIRFGCYKDIKKIIHNKKDFLIYRVGNAASGQPNHQVIVRGKLEISFLYFVWSYIVSWRPNRRIRDFITSLLRH